MRARVQEQRSLPGAPVMPVVRAYEAETTTFTKQDEPRTSMDSGTDDETARVLISGVGRPTAKSRRQGRQHQDRISPKGYASETYFGLVHTPIPLKKALKIPKAREAIDAEWAKLESRPAWDLNGVRPKAEVHRMKKTAHFGTLMALCYKK